MVSVSSNDCRNGSDVVSLALIQHDKLFTGFIIRIVLKPLSTETLSCPDPFIDLNNSEDFLKTINNDYDSTGNLLSGQNVFKHYNFFLFWDSYFSHASERLSLIKLDFFGSFVLSLTRRKRCITTPKQLIKLKYVQGEFYISQSCSLSYQRLPFLLIMKKPQNHFCTYQTVNKLLLLFLSYTKRYMLSQKEDSCSDQAWILANMFFEVSDVHSLEPWSNIWSVKWTAQQIRKSCRKLLFFSWRNPIVSHCSRNVSMSRKTFQYVC